jgi:E3 ubiquitin-protein ligase UBR3
MMLKKNDVPILLQDPLALMMHFILLLPVNIDKVYFDAIIKACYNLCVVQGLVRLTCGLSKKERDSLVSAHRREPTARKLSSYLGYAVSVMDSGSLYKDDGTSASSDLDGLDITDLEASAQELVLPFIRIAALVRHYVFEQDLPSIAEDANEFSGLIDFLELTNNKVVEEDEAMETEGAAIAVVSVADGLNWFRVAAEEGGQLEMDLWLQEFVPHIRRNCAKAKQLLQVNLLWSQPVLLRVPKNYDDIFQYYHKRKCSVCQNVPKDPTVCLMCGAMVCLKEACCKTEVNGEAVCETVRHSWDCGGGTGIFLAVNSSTIVVIRGKRACIWGSIYLDMFGEEDKELKRGKPLFLHNQRYRLLEHQWLTHKFDHTNRKWVMHRDAI